ncbi:hypothetical protein ACOMHN_001619 [Nucella lapillus]
MAGCLSSEDSLTGSLTVAWSMSAVFDGGRGPHSFITGGQSLQEDDEVLEWFPDEIGAVLPRVDGNAPGPEEPESEDDSPDDSDADADFEGLE